MSWKTKQYLRKLAEYAIVLLVFHAGYDLYKQGIHRNGAAGVFPAVGRTLGKAPILGPTLKSVCYKLNPFKSKHKISKRKKKRSKRRRRRR